MRILITSVIVAIATVASAQENGGGWKWEEPGVWSGTTDQEITAPRSVLDRLGRSRADIPPAHGERQQKWLDKFENRNRGGAGGEGAGGDAGGGGSHG